MGSDVKQFYNPDDGCIYFYDADKQCYRKICDVGSYAKLPFAVRQQIDAVKKDREFSVTYHCEEDGCAYCWNEANKEWVKICPVDALPESVKNALREMCRSIE